VHVVPNGVENVFLESHPVERGPWLVCTATITARKRTVELAEAAVTAEVPVWIIGQPYSEQDPYVTRFRQLTERHPNFVRYEGGISDRSKLAAIYRQARGFVLLSDRESLSLSALEAAACGCPLLLSDLPWARCTFGADASYCPIGSRPETARVLRRFYDAAPTLRPPPRPLGWLEVAEKFKALYAALLQQG
jgi:glycosyltransferase involved in cell wall biosynthesis